ncbi:DUF418 domain-containing protein [Caldalkalibacillus mannanilyticus]|uniref:DUF418 domain-containing protein n=1 Tax=Caldalkalibacillus mannanilyticus TaxID=1418 RepID=UPI0004695DC3|nr:DUF418 domain-containing protein [Caldalkalibacillus mannanilyticus]
MMSKRIEILDIARGAAILGTLGTNIWIFAHLGNYESLFFEGTEWTYSLDAIVSMIFLFFMNGKFLGLLTILFGMGLELKRQSYIRRNQENIWPWIYIWGMLLLFADGFLHFLFVFEYDVLMSYAISGIIVALLLRCQTKIIKRVAISLGLIHLILVILFSILIEVIFRADDLRQEFLRSLQEISLIYLQGTYLDQIIFRFEDFWVHRAEAIAIIPMNILLFLFGVYLVRSRVLEKSEEGRQRRKKMMLWGLGVGIPLNALSLLPFPSLAIFVRYIFAPLMAIGYFMFFNWLLERNAAGFFFQRLSEVGRTALSCYMLQNVVASILFYGWGFALGGTLHSIEIIGVWLLICFLMLLFAHFWLKKFTTGPFELIWRSLTNLPLKFLKESKKAA